MAGLVPTIHAEKQRKRWNFAERRHVDARDKRGHDAERKGVATKKTLAWKQSLTS